MKCLISIFFMLFFYNKADAQADNSYLKNTLQLNQSIFNYGDKRVFDFDFTSIDLTYLRYIKNFGFGLGLNRIQLKKDGLNRIEPFEEIERRDNLHLYYSQVLFSYRFVDFCPLKCLKVSVEIAPTFLIGGRNKYYSLSEGNPGTLSYNSYWQNPSRMEYETKFNVYARFGISYCFFKKYEFGLTTNSYVKYIAPILMSIPHPWSTAKQLNKNSYFSIFIKYNF